MADYDQIIYDVAIQNGFTPTAAKLVVAQARFESADYTSNVFKNNLNTSGMKFVGQPLASRGTLAPLSERSTTCKNGGTCVNSDYYAKFQSVADSAKDKIERNYNKTLGGVTPQQLKNAESADEFAALLKKRNYYGAPQSQYATGLKAKLLKVNILQFVKKNPKTSSGIGILVAGLIVYYIYYVTKIVKRQ